MADDNSKNVVMGDRQDGTITVDQQTRLVSISQRRSRLAIHSDVVVLPFDMLKVLGAQATLMDAGMMQVGPPTS